MKPFTLPSSWQRYVGVDWGFRAPWAVGWFAVDEDGRVWVYREIYETQVGEADQAKRILAAEGPDERIVSRFADDAMWATRGDAKEIAAVYADEGCHLTPAGKGPGSRIAGWQRIHSYLADAPACPHHRAMGWETCPRMHVFTTCPKWFEELSNLPHAQTGNPEDADTRAPDHLADLTRYVLLNLGTGPDWTILDEEKPSEIAEALGPYQPMGVFAYRPMADEPVWFADDEDAARRTVRTAELSRPVAVLRSFLPSLTAGNYAESETAKTPWDSSARRCPRPPSVASSTPPGAKRKPRNDWPAPGLAASRRSFSTRSSQSRSRNWP